MNETKFDGMGKVYSKYRPSYPREFIDHMYSFTGIDRSGVIADIGAGTGILTKLLLEKGNPVFAVEPNGDMRAVAETDLGSFPLFAPINGTAENTGLQNKSIDLITVAQAFHWFDPASFKKECTRILKPLGMVALVWNSRDEQSALVLENDEINRRYCTNFKGFSGGMRGTVDEGNFGDFFDGEHDTKVFENNISFDEEGFIGRNLSASYALKANDPEYQEYVDALRALFAKHSDAGRVIMPNFTRSYIGRV